MRKLIRIDQDDLPMTIQLSDGHCIMIEKRTTPPVLEDIRRRIEERLGLPPQAIRGTSKLEEVVLGKVIFMHLATKQGLNPRQIGEYLKCDRTNIVGLLSKYDFQTMRLKFNSKILEEFFPSNPTSS